MKRKWILGSLIGLAVVLILAVVIVAFSLGAIVKKGVEEIGPDATKVDVKLKGAQVWLVGGRVQLTGFFLGNPPGCRTPSSVEVGDVSVSVKPGSVFSDKIVVNSIDVKSPVITFEGGLTDNNLRQIEKNLNDYVGSSSTAPNSKAPPSSPAKQGKKLQVDDFAITGAKLQVNSVLSGDRTLTLAIPDIHLSGLGSGPEGITPVEVSQRALHAVLEAATKEVAANASKLGKDVVNEGKGALKDATGRLKGLLH